MTNGSGRPAAGQDLGTINENDISFSAKFCGHGLREAGVCFLSEKCVFKPGRNLQTSPELSREAPHGPEFRDSKPWGSRWPPQWRWGWFWILACVLTRRVAGGESMSSCGQLQPQLFPRSSSSLCPMKREGNGSLHSGFGCLVSSPQ